NARLAAARVAVGAAVPLERTQAEVERGRAEVGLLTARNDLRTQLLVLGQVIGRPLPENVTLATEFEVQDVAWDLETLLEMARGSNPDILAARANLSSAEAGVRMARSAYFPTLNMSAGRSGFAREAGNTSLLIGHAARLQPVRADAPAGGRDPAGQRRVSLRVFARAVQRTADDLAADLQRLRPRASGGAGTHRPGRRRAQAARRGAAHPHERGARTAQPADRARGGRAGGAQPRARRSAACTGAGALPRRCGVVRGAAGSRDAAGARRSRLPRRTLHIP